MERFNSGIGGYTCDGCGVLIWSGFHGLTHPENRFFVYGTREQDIKVQDGKAYCGSCKPPALSR